MTRSRSDLAEVLDELLTNGRVSLTETPDALVAYQLTGHEAMRVLALLTAAGWEDIHAEDEGGWVPLDSIEDEDTDITVRARKPVSYGVSQSSVSAQITYSPRIVFFRETQTLR
jgi:hypothetical protein